MPADNDLIAAIQSAMAPHADPVRGAQQQAYMKSDLPYLGLGKPTLTKALRSPLTTHKLLDRATWADTITALVDRAAYREEWYAALALAGHRHYRSWADEPKALDLYRQLIAATQWWDVVDEIAAHRVGAVLATHRTETGPLMVTWARDDHDLWLRRTAILAQLRHGPDTDTALLADVIDVNLAGSVYGDTFWIRKAIGWALRAYAAVGPSAAGWVVPFVTSRGDGLSGLSRREALKHL
ncbi:MAG: DNA alkylation repair protein [Nostocoides sp.]